MRFVLAFRRSGIGFGAWKSPSFAFIRALPRQSNRGCISKESACYTTVSRISSGFGHQYERSYRELAGADCVVPMPTNVKSGFIILGHTFPPPSELQKVEVDLIGTKRPPVSSRHSI